ncbi:exodeoxyribonuclease V subunit alpha [soil metagenome]
MTALGRLGHAAIDRSVVVSASGALAEFNDAGVLAPLDVLAATAMARVWGEVDEAVILAAALTLRGTRFGHVCVRLGTLSRSVVVEGQDPSDLELLAWPEPGQWLSTLESSTMVGDGTGEEPLVLQGGRLYLERYHRYERRVASLLLDRCGGPVSPGPALATEVLDRLLPARGGDTSSRQHEAVSLALASKLTVIVGGPGTGKTHTVGAMLAALAAGRHHSFPLVALCAPTGKAAARLGGAVRDVADLLSDPTVSAIVEDVEAVTIHRLMGWRWGRNRFHHDASNPLPHDIVIVDETSMVSLPMAAKLLEAVRQDASVVLVGDPFQLEAIEAGTVLADIVGPTITSGVHIEGIGRQVVTLDRIHRYDEQSTIADFADAVRAGDADSAVALLKAGSDSLRWVTEHQSDGFRDLWEVVVAQRSQMVELSSAGESEAALETLTDIAVLCAHRNGPESVAHWGRVIETTLDERHIGLRYRGEWYPGRPVMITRNDYRLGLFNGDIGVAVGTDDGLQAVFERDGARAFPLSHLGEHTTVHAMTIHKSQGSQFNQVAVMLPREESRLLTRQLLYTAITRASDRVWVVGSESVVRHAIGRTVERASGLGERLWA